MEDWCRSQAETLCLYRNEMITGHMDVVTYYRLRGNIQHGVAMRYGGVGLDLLQEYVNEISGHHSR